MKKIILTALFLALITACGSVEKVKFPAVQYVAKDPEACAKTEFTCPEPSQKFIGEYSCGCSWPAGVKVTSSPQIKNETKEKVYCTPNDREVKACIALYQPVCGHFNKEKCEEQCKKTYSNGCVACQDEKVEYWVEGECQTNAS